MSDRLAQLRRVTAWVLGVLLLLAPLPAWAGHDQDEDDLVYFLPIAAEHAKRLLDSGEKLFFFDLRDPEDFKREHLPGARSIPLKQLSKGFQRIPTAGRVVLYCGCPEGRIEEGYAYQLLRQMGYRNVSVLEGGFTEWRKLGYPVETDGSS
ncbi:MAG: cytochrome c oxidase cbb3-type subunit [Alphaproteobacteria bacterium]|jgi:rhodanese-related sulfurtransferase|nr:cytochrome c oxidase cbb3-type subunit [Alphaproteobacteria bacterium]